MRLTTAFLGLIIFLCNAGAVFAVDIDIDRVSDAKIYLCPCCQKPIRAGHIGEHAELMLAGALKTSLDARHIPYTEGKEKNSARLSILVYRFGERRGSNIGGISRPASGFTLTCTKAMPSLKR